MNVIEKTSPDGLVVERWRFCLIDKCLVLDAYTKTVRPSKRHKGAVAHHYERLNERDSTISEEQVPWSQELADEALRALTSSIRVGRWKTDFGR
jgi:hypothetical protein